METDRTENDDNRDLLRPSAVAAGVRYMIAAALFFSIMSVFVKAAGERLASAEIVLFRAVISLVLSYAWLRRASISPWGRARGWLLLRGVFGTTALICFYYALTALPLPEATVLQYTNPIFAALLAALFLRERVTPGLMIAIAVSIGGIVLIAQPAALLGGAGLPPTAVAISLLGAGASGAAYVLVRYLSDKEHPLVIVFYFPLVAVPVITPFAAQSWLWPTAAEWGLLIGVGLSTQIAQVAMTSGLARLPTGRGTAIGYVQIVFAGLWGALFFGEVPDYLVVVGAVLVAGSTAFLATNRGPKSSDEHRGGTAPGDEIKTPR